MSFDNVYPNRKDHRKQFFKKAQKHLRSYRVHGSCPYCQEGRKHSSKRRIPADEVEQRNTLKETE